MIAISGDRVLMRYGSVRFNLTTEAWINFSKDAVKTWKAARARGVKRTSDATLDELRAREFLVASGVRDVDRFEANLTLLSQPADPSHVIHCFRCGRALSDPISKALQMGPECRKRT